MLSLTTLCGASYAPAHVQTARTDTVAAGGIGAFGVDYGGVLFGATQAPCCFTLQADTVLGLVVAQGPRLHFQVCANVFQVPTTHCAVSHRGELGLCTCGCHVLDGCGGWLQQSSSSRVVGPFKRLRHVWCSDCFVSGSWVGSYLYSSFGSFLSMHI